MVHFSNLQVKGELLEALGIFKSEQKEPYLAVSQAETAFTLQYQQEAININKFDKGCIIFKAEKSEGYKVAVIAKSNRIEAVY